MKLLIRTRHQSTLKHGVAFFSLMRNLTLTGYYTTEMGIKELGYAGNQPNVWDGVPQEVLDEHGLSYDPEWIARCVDQSKRYGYCRMGRRGESAYLIERI